MNKNIKKIIITAFTVIMLGGISQLNNLKLLSTEAHAETGNLTIINIKTYTEDVSKTYNDEVQGDVYLRTLSISDGDLSFSKEKNNYDVEVDDGISEIAIIAKPDCDNDKYDNYEITINNVIVKKDDKFKKIVSLNKGKNIIKITVKNNKDEKRTYTINITRVKASSDNDNPNNDAITALNIKANQWVIVNGNWQYNDSQGNPVKNNWIKNYYLNGNGNVATGWLYYSGNWYYLGGDGAKKIGWQLVGEKWYYMDTEGRMQTGWIKDKDGKYYYLNTNGELTNNNLIYENN